MSPVFSTALQYPTLPLSVLLGFSMIYWLVSATGILGEPDGLGDGAAGDGFGDGPDLTSSAGLAALMDRFGFSTVPFVASASLIVLFMWVLTYWTHFNFLSDSAPAIRYGLGTAVILVSFFLALLPAALLLVPVRWFIRNVAVSKNETRTVQGFDGFVISPRVDAHSGRVSVNTSSPGVRLILDARSLSGEVYPHNTQIVVVSHDVAKGVCEVVSKEEFSTQ